MELKHLVVVAGATAVGKSLFLKRLTHRASNELGSQLRLDRDAWPQVNARQFDADAPRPFDAVPSDHAALHYEITRTWKRSYDHAEDPGLKLLSIAGKRTFVTLWAPANVLLNRLVTRDIKSWPQRFSSAVAKWSEKSPTARHARRLDFAGLYQDAGQDGGSELDQIYNNWFRFCSDYSSDDHWFLDTSSSDPIRRLGRGCLRSKNPLDDLLRCPLQAA